MVWAEHQRHVAKCDELQRQNAETLTKVDTKVGKVEALVITKFDDLNSSAWKIVGAISLAILVGAIGTVSTVIITHRSTVAAAETVTSNVEVDRKSRQKQLDRIETSLHDLEGQK